MKVVVDMNLALEWVSFLNERGHMAEHWSRLGDSHATDLEIANYCSVQNAVVLSGDMDFAEYHALQSTAKPSVIQLRAKDMSPRNLGPLVVRALSIANNQLNKGAIVTIKGTRMRITKLPIGNTDSF